MPKIIKEFIVIIVVLIIIVIGLASYIVYDKILNTEIDYEINNENNVCTNTNTNTTNNNSIDKEYNKIIKEIKDIYDVAYDFKTTQYVYCGESEPSNHQTIDDINDNVSTQFKTYDEMYNYLRQYMSEELIKAQRYFKENFYKEEDGKLYCLNVGKELSYNLGDVTISIDNIENNKISVTAMQEVISTNTYYQKIKLTYELVDNKYIVTSLVPIVKGIND